MATLKAIDYPDRLEASYRRFLKGYVKDLQDMVEKQVLKDPILRQDSLAGGFTNFLKELKRRFSSEWPESKMVQALKGFFGRMVRVVDTESKSKWGKVIAIDPFDTKYKTEMGDKFVNRNVQLIKSISDRYFNEIEQLVLNTVSTGEQTKELSKKIQERIGVSKSRADLIARDQTAKLLSEMNRQKQLDAGIEQARWSTSRDERVRASHRKVDGKIYDVNKGIIVDGTRTFPGMPIRCRCVGAPYLPGIDD